MRTICKKCKTSVTGIFSSGQYKFRHCGVQWFKPAADRGQRQVSTDGARIGGAIGGLIGLMHGDMTGGAAGVGVGAAIGKLFDSDNGVSCPKCSSGKAYPTGRTKYGKNQYQCKSQSCRNYLYK